MRATMHDSPETRLSLLLRLQGTPDELAWAEFCEAYHPILGRVAKSCGLRQQDVPDAVQEILMTVYRAIERYEPRPHPFAFRGWLAKIARNTTMNYLTRRLGRLPILGGDDSLARLMQVPEVQANIEQQWKLEHQRHLLEMAAIKVANRVNTKTFAAFWRTAVEGEKVETVAKDLELTAGAVYVARGRVMAHLQAEVRLLEQQERSIEDEVQ